MTINLRILNLFIVKYGYLVKNENKKADQLL
jgi:hypothetical protein